jgi:hypothetical protein
VTIGRIRSEPTAHAVPRLELRQVRIDARNVATARIFGSMMPYGFARTTAARSSSASPSPAH